MQARGSRILVLGLAVVVMFAALVLLGLWAQSAPPATPPPPTEAAQTTLTAQQAYVQARSLAQSWQADARLTGISASWPRASVENLLAGQSGWSLDFYSPSTGEMQYISVDPESVRLTRRRPVPLAPRAIDEAAWLVSAEDAVLYFLANGGDRFLRGQGGITAHIHLAVEGDGRLAWTVAAVRRDGSALVVAIDATSGERIAP
jgi:hypothetical protein